MSYRQAITEIT